MLNNNNSLLNPVSSTKYYCAIFEFAQGSYPRTEWENDSTLIPDSDGFRLLVVNTPTNLEPSINPEPTIIRSFFCSLHYISIHIQILDTEARGFSRPIVFVLANQSSTLIDETLCLYRESLLKLTKEFQKYSNDVFPIEIQKYAAELQFAVSKFGSENHGLQSKIDELKSILQYYDIQEIQPIENCTKTVEDFTYINNNLRDISGLIDLKSQIPKILNFIKTLPSTTFSMSSLTKLDGFDIAIGNNPSQIIQTLLQQNDSESISITTMFQNKTIFDCLFTIFSGKTLALITDNLTVGETLAKKLSIFSPFKESFSYHISRGNSPKTIECIPYNIIIAKRMKPNEMVNVFELQSCSFHGTKCSENSIIRHISHNCNLNNISENILILNSFNDIKHIFGKFKIKIAELTTRTLQTRERMLNSLQTIGFSNEDEPIIRHWMYCLTNKSKIRQVPLFVHV